MKLVADWHCPDLLTGPGNYLNKTGDAQLALAHCRHRRTAVQAGGHIGTWPVMLAAEFSQVLTFEPDFENFACLVRNLAERQLPRVFAARGILGKSRGPHSLRQSIKSTGQHRVGRGESVPCYRIDDLGLPDLDAIFLDVEGFEIPALLGAQSTVERCKPVIMAEENRRSFDQGFRLGDLERLLHGWGYRKVAAVNEDLVFAPA